MLDPPPSRPHTGQCWAPHAGFGHVLAHFTQRRLHLTTHVCGSGKPIPPQTKPIGSATRPASGNLVLRQLTRPEGTKSPDSTAITMARPSLLFSAISAQTLRLWIQFFGTKARSPRAQAGDRAGGLFGISVSDRRCTLGQNRTTRGRIGHQRRRRHRTAPARSTGYQPPDGTAPPVVVHPSSWPPPPVAGEPVSAWPPASAPASAPASGCGSG